MISIIGIIQRISTCNLRQCLGIPSVAAGKGNRNSHLTGLLHNQSHFLIITGHIYKIRIQCLDFCKRRIEVSILLEIRFCSHYLSAELREIFFKIFGQAFRIIGRIINQNRCFFYIELLGRKISHNLALIGINETGPERIRTCFSRFIIHCNLGICGSRGNTGDFSASCNRYGSQCIRAHIRRHHGNNALIDQLLRRRSCFRRLRLIIQRNQFQLFPENAAGFVDFLNRQLRPMECIHSISRLIAGHFKIRAYFDGVPFSGS